MLNKVGKALHHTLGITIFICLSTMFVLVFANVVLRYAFNSGITWSSEMSRYLFVWLVFLGAIAAMKDNMHLNMDIVTSILPPKAKKVFFVISNLLVLCTLGLFLKGSWSMTLLTMQRLSPATNIPLGYVYGVGIIASIAMGGIVLVRLVKTLTKGQKQDSQTNLQPEQTNYKLENY